MEINYNQKNTQKRNSKIKASAYNVQPTGKSLSYAERGDSKKLVLKSGKLDVSKSNKTDEAAKKAKSSHIHTVALTSPRNVKSNVLNDDKNKEVKSSYQDIELKLSRLQNVKSKTSKVLDGKQKVALNINNELSKQTNENNSNLGRENLVCRARIEKTKCNERTDNLVHDTKDKKPKNTILMPVKGEISIQKAFKENMSLDPKKDKIHSADAKRDVRLKFMQKEIKSTLQADSRLDPVDSTIEAQIEELLKVRQSEKNKIVNSNYTENKDNTKVADAKEMRKKIREKYTIRHYTSTDMNGANVGMNECTQKVCGDHNQNKDKWDSKSVSTKTMDSRHKSEKSTRKPVIKTIRSKHNAKIYKAVTFTESKARETTPIEIKIPSDAKETGRVERRESNDRSTEKSHSSRSKSMRKKQRKRHRHFPSPDPIRDGESPPTEVAKWAPSCVNKLTIPYYEAWVDTTLTAITKCSKEDKIQEKKNLLNSFKRFIEGAESPELVYDGMDEKYTGKIKIRRKNTEIINGF
ncbi:unnamed protein product [Leptosia nina]|uniref:Uncharacterized protein n=1 Tax=Leptosia nina TaxID=320188 RepID=A0AAV1JV79_9NEOP